MKIETEHNLLRKIVCGHQNASEDDDRAHSRKLAIPLYKLFGSARLQFDVAPKNGGGEEEICNRQGADFRELIPFESFPLKKSENDVDTTVARRYIALLTREMDLYESSSQNS